MSTPPGRPHRHVLTLRLGAVAVLCALPGLAVNRLIEGDWAVAVAGLASVAGTGGALCLERFVVSHSTRIDIVVRTAFIVAGGIVVAVVATLGARRLGDPRPGLGIVGDTFDAIVRGWSSLGLAPAPSAVSARLIVPIAVAVWAVAAVSAMLALRPIDRLSGGAGVVLPGVSLLAGACVVAGAAQPSGAMVGSIALVAGGVIVLSCHTERRIASGTTGELTGHRTGEKSGEHAIDRAGSATVPAAHGPTGGRLGAIVMVGLAAAGLVTAVAAGSLLTLGREEQRFDARNRFDPPVVESSAINPLDVVALARQQPDDVLFTVQSDGAMPIRLASLDEFDGARWTTSAEFERAGVSFEVADRPSTRTRSAEAEFRIAGLTGPWLPSTDDPVALHGVEALIDPISSSFVVPEGLRRDLTYVIDAEIPGVDVDLLRNGLPVSRDGAALTALQLPPDVPRQIVTLAEDIVADAASAFDEAVLLNDHLARTLTIDPDQPAGHSFGHLTAVLIETGVANEDQLATAFALLARSVGLPTRVTVGIDPAVVSEAGTFTVVAADLRVWPEVRFDDVGWVAFRLDTTDLGTDGSVLVGLDDATRAISPEVFATAATPTAVTPLDAPVRPGPSNAPTPGGIDSAAESSGIGRLDPAAGLSRLLIAVIIGGVLALGGAGAIVGAKRTRTARRRATTDPRRAVICAWDDVLERLREVDPEAASMNLLTVEEVIESNRRSGPAITAMYRPVTRALYDDRPIERSDVDQVWNARDRFVTSLNEHSSLGHRVRRAVDPRSFERFHRSQRRRTVSTARPTDTNNGPVTQVQEEQP